jgi:hypothetical protein
LAADAPSHGQLENAWGADMKTVLSVLTFSIAAARGRTPAVKKAPGPLVGTLESSHSKNDGLSVG